VPRPRSPRERFPWYPRIDCRGCLRDLECLNFCPANVFDWDPVSGAPIVARPLDCIPGCHSCAENCKGNSITLPGKEAVAAALKRIRSEEGRRSRRESVVQPGVATARGQPQGLSGEKKRIEGNKRKPTSHHSVIAFKLPDRKGPK